MKKIMMSAAVSLILISCGSGKSDFKVPEETHHDTESVTGNVFTGQYDPNKGIGKYTAQNLEINPLLNEKMAERGEKLYVEKCKGCHTVTKDTLKGPGWMDITKKRTAHWIMNYIINPHPMIEQDIRLKEQAEKTNIIMPDLALKDEEARDILEYMRKIDGVKTTR